MKYFRPQPITLFCMMGLENYMAQMTIMSGQCGACKNLYAKSDVNICKSFQRSWSLCCLSYISILHKSAFMDL